MNTEATAETLLQLDVCRSLFDALACMLEHNAGVRDYYPLSVLAAEGRRKIDCIGDRIDRASRGGRQD